MPGYSKLFGKTLALLADGFALGFVKDRDERKKILKDANEIWYSMDQKALKQLLQRAKLYGYIQKVKGKNNIEKINLTPGGRNYALKSKFYNLKLTPRKKWDKKWRMVLFDVPETEKKKRDALRRKLKNLGYLEFQKSVFIYPYPCENEINFVINFLDITDNVYYLETSIFPDKFFRSHFKI